MSLFKNREIKRQIIWSAVLTSAASAGGAFVSLPCACYVFAAGISVSLINLAFTKRRYDDLARLSEKIDQLLHGEEQVDFAAFREGEIAILESEIDKMAIRLREQAEALKQDKQYLQTALADISHQLRTPLTTLRIITARLRSEPAAADERIRLTMQADQLLSRFEWLVNSLLKISQLESGIVPFKDEPIELADLVGRATEAFAIPMELREQRLTIDISAGAQYRGDLSWSVEALENIIKNCVEHTPAGGEISIRGNQNPLYTELTITDNGPGIPAKDLPHIFERFYRGGDRGGSFGIGLALARMIIHRHNGTIKADHNKGGGARFTIRFYKSAM